MLIHCNERRTSKTRSTTVNLTSENDTPCQGSTRPAVSRKSRALKWSLLRTSPSQECYVQLNYAHIFIGKLPFLTVQSVTGSAGLTFEMRTCSLQTSSKRTFPFLVLWSWRMENWNLRVLCVRWEKITSAGLGSRTQVAGGALYQLFATFAREEGAFWILNFTLTYPLKASSLFRFLSESVFLS